MNGTGLSTDLNDIVIEARCGQMSILDRCGTGFGSGGATWPSPSPVAACCRLS
jgi:hypothetical protein